MGRVSYFLGVALVSFFAYELSSMYHQCTTNYKKKSKHLTKLEIDMRENLYEGIKMSAVRQSYFCRTYNFFYLIRMLAVILLIFNAQYIQIFQVIGSLAIMLSFTICTFYYNSKLNFFKSKFTKVFRLIQEVSMTLLVLLINVFYYNNNFNVLNS